MAGVNTLGTLNAVLFEELGRLNSLDVQDADTLKAEVERSKAIQSIAREVNTAARTVLDTANLRATLDGARSVNTPKMLEG